MTVIIYFLRLLFLFESEEVAPSRFNNAAMQII